MTQRGEAIRDTLKGPGIAGHMESLGRRGARTEQASLRGWIEESRPYFSNSVRSTDRNEAESAGMRNALTEPRKATRSVATEGSPSRARSWRSSRTLRRAVAFSIAPSRSVCG